MASRKPTTESKIHSKPTDKSEITGDGGELHQLAGGAHPLFTTQTGAVIADDENSLKAGPRGPSLLEDHVLLEKIQHFDHERIPERIVHARGAAAHGVFQVYDDSLSDYTMAKVLTDPGLKTPVFVRFSTVAGSRGSAD